jgi:hypothetical protein
VNDVLWQIIRPAIARLRASVMAVVFGLFGGFGLFAATVWLVLEGGTEFEGRKIVGPHLSLLSNYYPGYSVTWGGAFVGFAYAAVTGAVIGYLAAWVYNFVAFRKDVGSNASRTPSLN